MSAHRKPWHVLVAVLTLFSLVAAACGGSTSDSADDTPAAVDAGEDSDDDAMEDDEDAMEDDEASHSIAGLAECPNPIVFQTDWFPEPEHGALYNLSLIHI